LCLAFELSAPAARADALRRMEREVSQDKHSHNEHHSGGGGGGHGSHFHRSDPTSRSSRRVDDDSGSSESDGSGGGLAAMILILPWSLPYLSLEQGQPAEEESRNGCLTSYAAVPYQNGRGLLRDACDEQPQFEQRTSLALSAESGFMLQYVVPATFQARWLLPKRFELSGRADMLTDTGRAADRAWMGTAHLSYRFAQAKYMDFRTGVGPRVFELDRTHWGVDLLYAMDVYGRHPIVFRMELHVGLLGAAAFGQVRGTLGWMVGRAELYAGYEKMAMSDGKGAGVNLGGPIAGIRAWF